jgi:phosphoglycolate phosphatase
LKKYTTILFDLDGTLTDPNIGIKKSLLYALDKMGITESKGIKIANIIGPPLHESFMRYYAFSQAEAENAVSLYREYFSVKGLYENEMYAGIPELLRQLKSAQRMCICATSKPTVFAERILQHFDIDKYIEFVAGSSLGFKNTGKSEIIASVLNKITYRTLSDVVMVGDRAVDIRGAQENSIDSIAVTYGYGSMTELRRARPTYIVNSVKELGTILQSKVITREIK